MSMVVVVPRGTSVGAEPPVKSESTLVRQAVTALVDVYRSSAKVLEYVQCYNLEKTLAKGQSELR
jgi:hypothetical protein